MAQRLFDCERIGLTHWAGLLSLEDCQRLIAIGKEHLQMATVIDEQSGATNPHPERLSQMAWPEKGRYPLLQRIATGIAQFTGIPESHQEPLQILQYGVGGEYRPHFDAFAEGNPTLQQGGNRQLTMILYLNQGMEGGETVFPELGIRVYPLAGSGVLFRNLNSQGQREPLSLHAGNPITRGEKWIATIWIRQREYS